MSVLTAAQRASTTIASMRMVWTASTAPPTGPGCWAVRIAIVMTFAAAVAASPAGRRLRGDTEADELFQIARLDFEKVLARRESGERQVDLLNVGRRRRSGFEFAHGLAVSVEQMRAERGRGVAGAVRRHADQQPIGPRKLARGERHGIGIALDLLIVAHRPGTQHLRRSKNNLRPGQIRNRDLARFRVEHL